MKRFTPVHKDGCGVFGVIRRQDAPKIGSTVAVRAIECARFRGSELGAGFAVFNGCEGIKPPHKVRAFVDSAETLTKIKDILSEYRGDGLKILSEDEPRFTGGRFAVWTAFFESPSDEVLCEAVNSVNFALFTSHGVKGRIYSFGRYVDVYKGVGYPRDVAERYNLLIDEIYGDLWLSHTRQPTNSPGVYPIWSHPFSSFDCAIVHNGDLSSFGSNMRFLDSVGWTSHVGTDSEVVAQLLDYMVRVKKLSIMDAAKIIVNPYERSLNGDDSRELREMMATYRGVQLDGPFTIVAGYSDGEDTYMLALTDRSKFRPVVIGEDDERIYVASEECQIRAVSPRATVWTPEPGSYVLVSVRRGLIEAGRRHREYFAVPYGVANPVLKLEERFERRATIDAKGLSYRALNDLILDKFVKGAREVHIYNVGGQRYIGANLHTYRFGKVFLYGIPGNCLANLNNGLEFIVYGDAEDDVADTMHDGKVIIHGDARDVIGQALQGGEIFVLGSVGNRAAIQMREYRDKKPCMIIGGRADDYLGEYMAGGVVAVLGLGALGKDFDGQLVGKFAATGMVGGKIYVRGRVRGDSIGMSPPREDIVNYLRLLAVDDVISYELYDEITRHDSITYDLLEARLPSKVMDRLKRLMLGRHSRRLSIEYRELNGDDKFLLEKLKDFFATFGLSGELFSRLLESKFTTISVEGTETEVARSTATGVVEAAAQMVED